ncbi:MAG: hypothetical protein QM726_10375 [Chitinophagaceae bacterium]
MSTPKLAKTPVVITNGSQVYQTLLDSLYKQQDSLALCGRDGVVFFRMQLHNHHFENIRSSENAPPLLVKIISKIIINQDVRINTKIAKGDYFVLPVKYYFANNKPATFSSLLDATPKIDITQLSNKPINLFDKFFDMNTAEGEIMGAPCILLPWLSIQGKVQ